MILFLREKLRNIFRNRRHEVVVEAGSGRVAGTYSVREGSMLLDALLARGQDFPHLCKLGDCGRCRTQLLSGEIRRAGNTPGALSDEELSQGMFFACRATPLTALRLKILGKRSG